MRLVLFDDETFEPLTVLEIPRWGSHLLRGGGVYRIAVPPPPVSVSVLTGADLLDDLPKMEIVSIRIEPLRRKGQLHYLAFTGDSESALKLRAAFLPGQRGELNLQKREAYVKGIGDALLAAMGR